MDLLWMIIVTIVGEVPLVMMVVSHAYLGVLIS